jgi:hypothetical protein
MVIIQLRDARERHVSPATSHLLFAYTATRLNAAAKSEDEAKTLAFLSGK